VIDDVSELILACHDIGSAGERVEQEILLVENVVDAEVEREILGCFVVNLGVDNEVFVESAVDMRNDVGVVEGRIAPPQAQRRPLADAGVQVASRLCVFLR
jgi:hypothetical protein